MVGFEETSTAEAERDTVVQHEHGRKGELCRTRTDIRRRKLSDDPGRRRDAGDASELWTTRVVKNLSIQHRNSTHVDEKSSPREYDWIIPNNHAAHEEEGI